MFIILRYITRFITKQTRSRDDERATIFPSHRLRKNYIPPTAATALAQVAAPQLECGWDSVRNACGSIRNQRRNSLRTTIREAERRDHDDDGCGGRRGVEVFISTVERWLTCSLRLHTKLTISADEDQTERPDQTRPGVGARRLSVLMSWVWYTYTYGRDGKLMCVLFCISTIPGRWAIRARCLSAGAQDAQALYRVICLFGYIWPRMRMWKMCFAEYVFVWVWVYEIAGKKGFGRAKVYIPTRRAVALRLTLLSCYRAKVLLT